MLRKKRIQIIAEAGVNHNGSITVAKKLIDGAAAAGADYIKFQLFKAKDLATQNTDKADYQVKQTGKIQSQYDMLKEIELSFASHVKLKHYANKKKIKFLTSAFDLDGLDSIMKMKLDYIKIPSGEITNIPYLRKVGKFNVPTILSTGMSTINEVSTAIKILKKAGLKNKNLTVLQCSSEYPSPVKDANMNVLNTFKKKFRVNIGYSDHTLGFESSIIAVSFGAKIIEKHITINRKMRGPDHSASLSLEDFKSFVRNIRNAEIALGSSIKKPSSIEKNNIRICRKKILTKRKIKKGEKFTNNNVTTLRSNVGISSIYWDKIIGKKSTKNYQAYEPVQLKIKS